MNVSTASLSPCPPSLELRVHVLRSRSQNLVTGPQRLEVNSHFRPPGLILIISFDFATGQSRVIEKCEYYSILAIIKIDVLMVAVIGFSFYL